MKWWYFLLIGVLVLLSGAIGISLKMAPWWKVEVDSNLPNAKVNVSRWKVALILTRLDIWNEGVWTYDMTTKEEKYIAPRKVLLFFDNNPRSMNQMLGGPSKEMWYGDEVEITSDNILRVQIGLSHIPFFNNWDKTNEFVNKQLLKNFIQQAEKGDNIRVRGFIQTNNNLDNWPIALKTMIEVYEN